MWQRLAFEFASAGHEVTLVSPHSPNLARREKVNAVDHIRLQGADDQDSFLRNLVSDFRWSWRVARNLPAADVVICHTVTLPVWLRWLKPSAGRVAVVLENMPKGAGRFYGAADHLLPMSAAIVAKLGAGNPRLARRITPFHHPIDWATQARWAESEKFSHASAESLSGTRKLTIGYVGPIHPEKGLRLLLRAAELLLAEDVPPWRLEIIGPSSISQGGGGEMFRDALSADFGRALGDRIAFVDHVSDAEQLAARYGAMDLFCYPSLTEKRENFPVTVAEAMAAGATPVVSDLPCFRELVRDEETGLIFDQCPPGGEERLAAKFARLLRDGGLRRGLARRAQEQVRRYDYTESARSLAAQLTSPKT
ncbi:MAG: glycosyltransferase family 4 protein [Opitutaceae bacterium]